MLSVSLHIYKTPELNLSGVRIFDTEKKRWAVLTDKAPSCSWNLPDEAFEKVTNAKNKELYLIDGATHIQTYWKPEYVEQAVNKLVNFYQTNL